MNLKRLFIVALATLFTPAYSPSLGAKTGTITSPTGADTNMRTLGDSTPPRYTLAGVVRAALQLAAAAKKVIVNFGVRKAVIVPTATTTTSVSGASGVALLGSFEKTDASKPSSAWVFTPAAGAYTDLEAELSDLVADKPPTFTVESLTNAIDDIASEVGGEFDTENQAGMIIYDQADGVVYAYAADDGTAAHTAAVALTEDAQFVQNVDSASTQFGE